jgi:hypothetical protein
MLDGLRLWPRKYDCISPEFSGSLQNLVLQTAEAQPAVAGP